MSRSRKKHSRLGLHIDKFFKRLCHTRNRMLERNDIYLTSRTYKHTVDSWDICDYRGMVWDNDSEWYEKGLRK